MEEIIAIKKDYINTQRNKEPKEGVLFREFIISTIIKRQKRVFSDI